jgi:hypothetical protein
MSWQNRVSKLINLDIKIEIISKQESGKSVGVLSADYGMAMLFIRESLFIVFTKEISFMLFKFRCTLYKR